eukprot:scaffold61902_cov31-Phaeocystis_antarctica.AAC.1
MREARTGLLPSAAIESSTVTEPPSPDMTTGICGGAGGGGGGDKRGGLAQVGAQLEEAEAEVEAGVEEAGAGWRRPARGSNRCSLVNHVLGSIMVLRLVGPTPLRKDLETTNGGPSLWDPSLWDA